MRSPFPLTGKTTGLRRISFSEEGGPPFPLSASPQKRRPVAQVPSFSKIRENSRFPEIALLTFFPKYAIMYNNGKQ